MTDTDKHKQALKALKEFSHSHHIFHRIYTRTLKKLEELYPRIFTNPIMKEKLDESDIG